jgi:3-isopropylmalate dehydratase small subunit
MVRTLEGHAWRFGSDIDTDVIIPSQHMSYDPDEYSEYAMAGVDPDFTQNLSDGDVIVAETNFGIGSSREHAVLVLKHAGVGGVIAESFGRIFYRNAINQAFPVLQMELGDIQEIEEGDRLEVDVFDGTVRNKRTGAQYRTEELSEIEREILEAGGAVNYYG